MTHKESSSLLHHILKQVGECFDLETARKLVALRLDKRTQAKLDEWANKSTEGTFTSQERDEYLAVIDAMDIVAILQGQARQKLKKRRTLVS